MVGNEHTPSLLPLAEVARRLGISLRSLRGIILRGAIPVVRPTRRRMLISEDDLRAYIASCRDAAPKA